MQTSAPKLILLAAVWFIFGLLAFGLWQRTQRVEWAFDACKELSQRAGRVVCLPPVFATPDGIFEIGRRVDGVLVWRPIEEAKAESKR